MTIKVVVGPSEGAAICDFCSSPDVWTMYPADSFVHDVIEGMEISSSHQWAACKTCSGLIEADRWKDLVDRAEQAFVEKYRQVPGLRKRIKMIHDQFRQHRKAIA